MTAVILPALLLQKLEVESLPSIIVFDPPPPPLLPVSFVRPTSRMEGKEVPYTRSGRRSIPGGKSSAHLRTVAPQYGTPPSNLQRVPSGFTKEAFPMALQGLLVEANTIKLPLLSAREALGQRGARTQLVGQRGAVNIIRAKPLGAFVLYARAPPILVS